MKLEYEFLLTLTVNIFDMSDLITTIRIQKDIKF